MVTFMHRAGLLLIVMLAGCAGTSVPMMPRVQGPWWTVAGNPDLGELNGPRPGDRRGGQQPVDFAVWQAADGTWQLWSCIRGTKCEGNTRLFYGWEGARLTDRDWKPMGIKMRADPQYGETPGGLQAPHVVREGDTYYLFYGDWVNICLACSLNGKTFERWLMPNGEAGMFSEGDKANTRDAMATVVRSDPMTWYCYYTASGEGVGADYCRTSHDLRTWSEPKVVARGGMTGTGGGSAECPHVVFHSGYYYLFRTQRYGGPPTTSVYRSKDPMDFGVDTDDKFVCLIEVAAPEIVIHEGQWYIAALLPDLQGIRIARLAWVPDGIVQ
ncbi:MAG: hypothetical protein HY718_18175 [Planctomycetes bacterium]|nr:hypothetical protein [Planctomycetota bacterium]